MELLTVQCGDVESEQLKERIGALELTSNLWMFPMKLSPRVSSVSKIEIRWQITKWFIVSESEDEASPSEIQKASSSTAT